MNKKKLRRLQKSRMKKDPPAETKPKRKWLRYAVLISLGIATSGALYLRKNCSTNLSSEIDGPTQKKEQQSEIPRIKIPPAMIEIKQQQLKKGSPDFRRVDAMIESLLKKTEDRMCAFDVGLKNNVPGLMFSIKRKLEADGLRITSGATSPREIFVRINSYYMDNNVWMFIRTGQRTEKGKQGSQKVACLMKVPVEGRALLTFSYFGGKISASDVPIYYLTGEGMFETGGVIGAVTEKRGLMIYSGKINAYGMEQKKGLYDISIHEGVHFSTMRKEKREGEDDYDYDANADTPDSAEEKLERDLDELRAYLVQMIYGNYPAFALNSVMLSGTKQYSYARKVIKESAREMLLKKQESDARYMSRGITAEDLSKDEIRELAYRIYLKHFPQK